MTIPSKYNPQPPREIKVKFNGVSATLAIPHSMDSENPFEENLAPMTHKAVIILHGQGGHRDYCYQQHLAHRLAKDLGIFSLRIDFRGCGDSDDNEIEIEGRHLDQDVEDIQNSAEFLRSGEKNGIGIDLTINSIISHSRGGVAMFLWALKQDELLKQGNINAIVVPNLINCAARFTSETVLERYSHFVNFDYIPDVIYYRYGKYQKGKLAAKEIITLSKPNFSNLTNLSRDFSVLSIYGLHDEIIPRYDCSNFANALNRGPKSHTLKLIPEADHNFYGFQKIEPDDDLEEMNPLNLPLKKGRINYNYLVVDYILDFLSPENEFERFLLSSNVIGSVSRWKHVEGVNNFRDLGGWRILHPTFDNGNVEGKFHYVKPNVAFRCANISGMTENGLKTIQKLGIKAIFDLRSDGEISADGYPPNLSSYGIKRIHAPIYAKDDYSPQAIALRYTNLMTSWSTYVHVYKDMFEFGKEAFRTIFLYILEENQPFLFHCTAGKDRTGVFGMLYLLLAGVDKDTISKEYELTTIGLKPDHPILKAKFIEAVNKIRSKFGGTGEDDALENMISQGRKDWKIEEQGFQNLVSSRYEAMLATIQLFNELYGNIVKYMETILGFSLHEIEQIYNRIITSDPQNFGFELNTQLRWDHRAKI
ncbi:uncharacterized protein KGF55_002233 [Candida pseudojiufengensis]|uniref:uncharacterized protein n=1 Tax=Candida pseudojiufengensis TaxID=497109 RepID=UPI002224FA8B|nr:uncharacterized protein KGF55_002233 [Candida pseudojiufengensis]KAI5964291.1 hypothetical protein KGF55_002233 [Candida pseudojiufengensis]